MTQSFSQGRTWVWDKTSRNHRPCNQAELPLVVAGAHSRGSRIQLSHERHKNPRVMKIISCLRAPLILFIALSVALSARAENAAKAVYTQSNSAAGNQVVAFNRAANGRLESAGSYPTGGMGTGGGLGSQGALALSHNHRWLLVVNAGSNNVSVFAVQHDGLVLTDIEASGGSRPISVTIDHNLVYVLNAGGAVGGSDNITGFYLSNHGDLLPLPDSTRPLSAANVGPAQVSFSPSGDRLMVTEKGTNQIATFAVDDNGVSGWADFTESSGLTPFGFAFTPSGVAIVSEAFGGAAGASGISSYDVESTGWPVLVTASLTTQQTAACWVAVARNGRYAYVTNTGSNTVTGVRVAHDGSLTLLDADGSSASTGVTPIDAAVSNDDRFLYVLTAGDRSISQYRIAADGTLTSLGAIGGLSAGTIGLLAR